MSEQPDSALNALSEQELIFVELVSKRELTRMSRYACYQQAFGNNVSDRSACTLSWKLMKDPRIIAALDELRAEVIDETVASLNELRVQLTEMTRADITELCRWNVVEEIDEATGEVLSATPVPVIRRFEDVPPELRRMVKSITYTKMGPKLEFYDRQRAIELLVKMQGGLAPERLEISGPDGGAVVTRDLSIESATELYRRSLEG